MKPEIYINKHDKPVWKNITLDTPFTSELFHDVKYEYETSDTQRSFHSNLGSITVVDRLTGYSGYVRDIETGYRDPDGNFWLASCNCDVTQYVQTTVGDAIDWIKKHANTCVPRHSN